MYDTAQELVTEPGRLYKQRGRLHAELGVRKTVSPSAPTEVPHLALLPPVSSVGTCGLQGRTDKIDTPRAQILLCFMPCLFSFGFTGISTPIILFFTFLSICVLVGL